MTSPDTTPPPDAGQPETRPENKRVLIFGVMPDGTEEMAMGWKDRIDQKWYYAPQGGLVQFEVKQWLPVPQPNAPHAPPREVTEALSDTSIREVFVKCGGKFNGPKIETAHIPEAKFYSFVRECSRLNAALNAPARVDDWRPIETAPKNGSILLWFPWGTGTIDSQTGWQGTHFIGIWSSDGDGGELCWRDPEDYEDLGQPSHWMPIPAPPSSHTASDFSEMRDICGGEVGEITRTPEEQAALERAMGDVAPNPNALPMEMLPEGWRFDNVLQEWANTPDYECLLMKLSDRKEIVGKGPTPRAAMIAAIEATREREQC